MFYSKYSDYSPEQIMSSDYEILCKKILSMSEDEQVTEKIKRYTI